MVLTGLNTTAWLHGSYENDLIFILKVSENDALRLNPTAIQNLAPHIDRVALRGSIAIGYGLDLIRNELADINAYVSDANQILSQLGEPLIQLTSQAQQLIQNYRDFWRAGGNITSADVDVLDDVFTLSNEAQAEALLKAVILDKRTDFNNYLNANQIQLVDSRERYILESLWYQSKVFFQRADGSATNMVTALQQDDRAEAWFEIRYNSNGGNSESDGIARRRYFQSSIFGLYDFGVNNSTTISEDNANQVYRSFTRHREQILNYENKYSSQISHTNSAYGISNTPNEVQPLQNSLTFATDKILEIFGNGQSISWQDIYVGEDASSTYYRGTDNDVLAGTTSDDLILGESGLDVLFGNCGNNLLYGSAGVDLYNVEGDSSDYIDDTDGNGAIVGGTADAPVFYTAGFRQTNADGNATGDWAGKDGVTTYSWSGNDGDTLTINRNGQTITVANYFEGDLNLHHKFRIPARAPRSRSRPFPLHSTVSLMASYYTCHRMPYRWTKSGMSIQRA